MAYLFGALSTAKLYDVNRIKDEFVDQLHYIVTSMALVVCATCVCFKQFAGRPIECAVGATVEDNDADVSWRARARTHMCAVGGQLLLVEEHIFCALGRRDTRRL